MGLGLVRWNQDKALHGFLPPEPGIFTRAGKILHLCIPLNTADKLLAERGNGEAVFLNRPPIYHKRRGLCPFPKQVPVPLRDKAVGLVSACGFRISPADIPGYRRNA